VARVGFLLGGAMPSPGVFEADFREVLRERGWVEGRNIRFDYRAADGRYDRLPALAAELIALKVDLIVTEGTPPTMAAKTATTTIPIVMATTGDPVMSGLVASLARPGGNLTGASFFFGELNAKRLEILKEAVPGITRVAVLSHPGNPVVPVAIKAIQNVAGSLKVTLRQVEVRAPSDLDSAVAALTRRDVDALMVVESPMINARYRQIADIAARNRLPTIFGIRGAVEDGGLMAYGPSRRDLWRRAAVLAHKILHGAKPGDLPIEQAAQFEFVVNLRTAKALGLTLPPSILTRATDTIQ
jgi:putative ABC transport system substrate-binding protein